LSQNPGEASSDASVLALQYLQQFKSAASYEGILPGIEDMILISINSELEHKFNGI
jgi:hypothetical protein